MVVVTKEAKSQQATNKMREELERVNSDLATAMKGLQEVSAEHFWVPGSQSVLAGLGCLLEASMVPLCDRLCCDRACHMMRYPKRRLCCNGAFH